MADASNADTDRQSHPLLSTFVRIFWMLAGNAGLFALALVIRREPAIGVFDALYGALVVALIGARWADVALLHGDRADGRPATMRDFGRYALMLVGIAAAGYAIAFFTRAG